MPAEDKKISILWQHTGYRSLCSFSPFNGGSRASATSGLHVPFRATERQDSARVLPFPRVRSLVQPCKYVLAAKWRRSRCETILPNCVSDCEARDRFDYITKQRPRCLSLLQLLSGVMKDWRRFMLSLSSWHFTRVNTVLELAQRRLIIWSFRYLRRSTRIRQKVS